METQKQEPKYIPLKDFKTENPLFGDRNTEWYYSIIKGSLINKLTLIKENLDEAMNVFCRFDDLDGFRLVIGSTDLPENYRAVAQMQLESLTNTYQNMGKRETKEEKRNRKYYERSLGQLPGRRHLPICDHIQSRNWTNASFAEFQYNGGFAD